MFLPNLEIKLTSRDRIHSSFTNRGIQKKWYKGGYWFKANQFGYENIAEWVASSVLSFSTVPKNIIVPYGLCVIEEESGKKYSACYSKNFLSSNDGMITIDRLLTLNGIDVEEFLEINSVEYKINFVIDLVQRCTGLNITDYLRTILTFDAFILNGDRHFHNIALIYNRQKGFRVCPIYDNGSSLLSDRDVDNYYESLRTSICEVDARPFSYIFEEQMAVLGIGMHINGSALENFIATNRKVMGRTADVLEYQMKRYNSTIIKH